MLVIGDAVALVREMFFFFFFFIIIIVVLVMMHVHVKSQECPLPGRCAYLFSVAMVDQICYLMHGMAPVTVAPWTCANIGALCMAPCGGRGGGRARVKGETMPF